MTVLHGDDGHDGRQEQCVELVDIEGAAVSILGHLVNSGKQAHDVAH